MGYEVSFAKDLVQVPTRIRLRLSDRLEEVANAIATIPSESVIKKSVLEGALVIEIADWRFEYRVEPERARILVIDAAELSRPPPLPDGER
jgi:mRNA-degrading endonuclease RelE of RelBE toxin-antitoxin system